MEDQHVLRRDISLHDGTAHPDGAIGGYVALNELGVGDSMLSKKNLWSGSVVAKKRRWNVFAKLSSTTTLARTVWTLSRNVVTSPRRVTESRWSFASSLALRWKNSVRLRSGSRKTLSKWIRDVILAHGNVNIHDVHFQNVALVRLKSQVPVFSTLVYYEEPRDIVAAQRFFP